MTRIERLKRNLFFGGLSQEDYHQVRESVQDFNRNAMVTWSIVLGAFWIYSLLMSLGEQAPDQGEGVHL